MERNGQRVFGLEILTDIQQMLEERSGTVQLRLWRFLKMASMPVEHAHAGLQGTVGVHDGF